MCGRFSLFNDIGELQEQFGFSNLDDLRPRYNIAPGQDILAVINDGRENRAGFLKWGLIPFYSKDTKIANYTKNARAETVDSKPSFRASFKRKRCVILASGFFEWNKFSDRNEPFHIFLQSKAPMAFAGLWDEWTKNDHEKIYSCTIVTTQPNEMMGSIHPRMPVILPKEHQAAWLDSTITDKTYLKTLLQSYPPSEMGHYEVSTLVNSSKNDVPEVLMPIAV